MYYDMSHNDKCKRLVELELLNHVHCQNIEELKAQLKDALLVYKQLLNRKKALRVSKVHFAASKKKQSRMHHLKVDAVDVLAAQSKSVSNGSVVLYSVPTIAVLYSRLTLLLGPELLDSTRLVYVKLIYLRYTLHLNRYPLFGLVPP
jgi:hypothetical protein